MSEIIDIVVPDLGDFSDVEVIEILVEAGAQVAEEDGLITIETDKAAMDVPSPAFGTIETITVSALVQNTSFFKMAQYICMKFTGTTQNIFYFCHK